MVGLAWFRSTTASMQLASGYACSTQKALRGGQADPSASYASIALFEGSCNRYTSSHTKVLNTKRLLQDVNVWLGARAMTSETDRTFEKGLEGAVAHDPQGYQAVQLMRQCFTIKDGPVVRWLTEHRAAGPAEWNP